MDDPWDDFLSDLVLPSIDSEEPTPIDAEKEKINTEATVQDSHLSLESMEEDARPEKAGRKSSNNKELPKQTNYVEKDEFGWDAFLEDLSQKKDIVNPKSTKNEKQLTSEISLETNPNKRNSQKSVDSSGNIRLAPREENFSTHLDSFGRDSLDAKNLLREKLDHDDAKNFIPSANTDCSSKTVDFSGWDSYPIESPKAEYGSNTNFAEEKSTKIKQVGTGTNKRSPSKEENKSDWDSFLVDALRIQTEDDDIKILGRSNSLSASKTHSHASKDGSDWDSFLMDVGNSEDLSNSTSRSPTGNSTATVKPHAKEENEASRPGRTEQSSDDWDSFLEDYIQSDENLVEHSGSTDNSLNTERFGGIVNLGGLKAVSSLSLNLLGKFGETVADGIQKISQELPSSNQFKESAKKLHQQSTTYLGQAIDSISEKQGANENFIGSAIDYEANLRDEDPSSISNEFSLEERFSEFYNSPEVQNLLEYLRHHSRSSALNFELELLKKSPDYVDRIRSQSVVIKNTLSNFTMVGAFDIGKNKDLVKLENIFSSFSHSSISEFVENMFMIISVGIQIFRARFDAFVSKPPTSIDDLINSISSLSDCINLIQESGIRQNALKALRSGCDMDLIHSIATKSAQLFDDCVLLSLPAFYNSLLLLNP